jgi:hypothetical protein
MTRQSRKVVAAQLGESLSALRAGVGDPFEIAVLAGLLQRAVGTAPDPSEERTLTEARQLWDTGTLFSTVPLDDAGDAIVDRLCALQADDSEEERAELLQDLDELCAGLSFVGQSDRCGHAAREAAGVIRAFPALFRPLAGWASRILADEPPSAGDPARQVWQALEASQFPELAVSAPACDDARRRLGLPLVIRRSLVGLAPPALLAASELPVPPALLPLGHGPGYELALGELADGQLALLMTSTAPVQLLRSGIEVALEHLAPGFDRAPAIAGEYQLRVGDAVLAFEVVD